MNSIELRKPTLPDSIKELHRFVLVGREKLIAVKAEIRAISKVGLAKEVRDQKNDEAQMLASALLDAETKIGELLKDIDKKESYKGLPSSGGRKPILPEGITHKQSHIYQTLADNVDLIEEVKKEAIENDDLPTRTEVLRKVKEYQKENKIKQIIEKGKTNKLPSNIQLLEGDIFEVINKDKNKSIDTLIVDPPYLVMNDYTWDKQDENFHNNWLQAIKPKMNDAFNMFIFMDARVAFDFECMLIQHQLKPANKIIWIRKNMAKGKVIKNSFISSYEVIFYINNNKKLNLPDAWGSERFDSVEYAVPQSNFADMKMHPVQKPIELIKHLINVGTFENDTILDCFAGSGTTGVGCKELNRNCILIEQNKQYIDIIRGRL